MKIEDIKSNEQVLDFIEGLCNDLEAGVTTTAETKNQILRLVTYLIELDRKKIKQVDFKDKIQYGK